jgi:restriction system protein
MGYGAGDMRNALHTGRPGDGGVDGIINEDRLGLGQIYIQAKRYSDGHPVSTEEIQRFVGAMKNVQKGVFITTSSFRKDVRDYAEGCSQSIKLVDGDQLTEWMIALKVGVQTDSIFEILRIDNNFFSEDDF